MGRACVCVWKERVRDDKRGRERQMETHVHTAQAESLPNFEARVSKRYIRLSAKLCMCALHVCVCVCVSLTGV